MVPAVIEFFKRGSGVERLMGRGGKRQTETERLRQRDIQVRDTEIETEIG